jgi:hypothetical protein
MKLEAMNPSDSGAPGWPSFATLSNPGHNPFHKQRIIKIHIDRAVFHQKKPVCMEGFCILA